MPFAQVGTPARSLSVKVAAMRVLIVSDIHSNYAALETVLAVAAPFDQLWNLGDTIGYGGTGYISAASMNVTPSASA